jgi:hypothetical protein
MVEVKNVEAASAIAKCYKWTIPKKLFLSDLGNLLRLAQLLIFDPSMDHHEEKKSKTTVPSDDDEKKKQKQQQHQPMKESFRRHVHIEKKTLLRTRSLGIPDRVMTYLHEKVPHSSIVRVCLEAMGLGASPEILNALTLEVAKRNCIAQLQNDAKTIMELQSPLHEEW